MVNSRSRCSLDDGLEFMEGGRGFGIAEREDVACRHGGYETVWGELRVPLRPEAIDQQEARLEVPASDDDVDAAVGPDLGTLLRNCSQVLEREYVELVRSQVRRVEVALLDVLEVVPNVDEIGDLHASRERPDDRRVVSP